MATKKLSEYKGPIGQITKVNSTAVVENLNAQMIGGNTINSIFHNNGLRKITDFNELRDIGLYFMSFTDETVNAPSGSYEYGILVVFDATEGTNRRTTQVYFPDFMKNSAKYLPRIRNAYNNSWGDWLTISVLT